MEAIAEWANAGAIHANASAAEWANAGAIYANAPAAEWANAGAIYANAPDAEWANAGAVPGLEVHRSLLDKLLRDQVRLRHKGSLAGP